MVIFAGYNEENPRITTACGHHFHLACIYEWMERSKHCPLCDKVFLDPILGNGEFF
jgi:hypothetical protein